MCPELALPVSQQRSLFTHLFQNGIDVSSDLWHSCRSCHNGIVFLLSFHPMLFDLSFSLSLTCSGLLSIVYLVELLILLLSQEALGALFSIAFRNCFCASVTSLFLAANCLASVTSLLWSLPRLSWPLMVAHMNEEVYR